MQIFSTRARTAAASVAVCFMFSAAGIGQHGQPTIPVPPGGSSTDPMERPMGPPPGFAERQAKARNDERQKRLVSDTDKLLELATQLHTDVGKTDRNVLSLDVIKRADEIERLAHAVKERMKG